MDVLYCTHYGWITEDYRRLQKGHSKPRILWVALSYLTSISVTYSDWEERHCYQDVWTNSNALTVFEQKLANSNKPAWSPKLAQECN